MRPENAVGENVRVGVAARRAAPSWRQTVALLARNWLVVQGSIIVLLLIAVAVFAEFIAPFPPLETHVKDALHAPGLPYVLGTDRLGRDALSRLIYGTRVSLSVAGVSILIASVSGGLLGILQGYKGGALDMVIGRLEDVLFAFPALLLAIAIAGILGSGTGNAILAIAVVYAPQFARIVRSAVIAERHKDYIVGARVIGAREARIVFRHLLPNVLPVLIIQASVSFSHAILYEAALSYVGLGTQPPNPSWGTMLSEGRTFLETAPWMSVCPGLAIMLAVLAFNLLGDGLRDTLDPALRGAL